MKQTLTVSAYTALLLSLVAFTAGIVVGARNDEPIAPATSTTAVPTPTPVPLVSPLSR